MTVWQGLLITLGVLLALVLICAVTIWLERKFPSAKFDERQKIARGNAHRLSSLVGDVYGLVVLTILIRQVENEKLIEPYLLVFGGLLLQVMVLHIYCILTHAALPLSEKPGVAVASYLFVGTFYLLSTDFSGPFPLVGKGSEVWAWLGVMVSFYALAVMHIIYLLRREKE